VSVEEALKNFMETDVIPLDINLPVLRFLKVFFFIVQFSPNLFREFPHCVVTPDPFDPPPGHFF
jgi:hypothetical protein